MFYLIGVVCGLVIYNFIIIGFSFFLALYKKLFNRWVCEIVIYLMWVRFGEVRVL